MKYIFVPENKEECRKAQEIFFANGGKWLGEETTVQHKEASCLYFYPPEPCFDYFHMTYAITRATREILLEELNVRQIFLEDIPLIFFEKGTFRAKRNVQNLERDPLDTSHLSIPLRDKLLGRDTHAELMQAHYARSKRMQNAELKLELSKGLKKIKEALGGPLDYAPQGGDNKELERRQPCNPTS